MENRKKDHIDLALRSQTLMGEVDMRFSYEPLLAAHRENAIPQSVLGGHTLSVPLWVSSMTGGTKLAGTINKNLAQACNEFGFGMGLGSCRIILDDDTYFGDFDVRQIIGDHLPLYANLGIAQVEQLLDNGAHDKIINLVQKLRADGLIVHINPMQEWVQPEGDRFRHAPIDTIKRLLDLVPFGIIVKEVGQGMGQQSLEELLKLPLDALEFAAFGGTNFAKVELMRGNKNEAELFESLTRIGHTAQDMLNMVNGMYGHKPQSIACKQLIISGGVQTFLDGYYLINKSRMPAIYGQASAFLRYAKEDYETLRSFVAQQIAGLNLAYNYLKIRS